LSIIRSKSIISNISDRLHKLEAEKGDEAPEVEADAELQTRYAKYKEEKAEKWKRLNREPTYHESWAELTFSQYVYCIRGKGTPEERYQFEKQHSYWHESY
jgi:hypothetical protein